MKTKILSVLLACLMVLSVMPFAAFAEETVKCALVGNADHTLDNCPDAKKLDVIPSQCGEYGYTLYQCPVCNDYFAADFNVVPGNHDWVEIEAAIPATCTAEGKEAVEKCSVCQTTKGGNVISMKAHAFEVTSGNCVEGATSVCTICGFQTVTGQMSHTWANVPTIKVEPVCEIIDGKIVYQDGEAEFACATCGEVKTVVIKADHVKATLDYHAPVAPDCLNAGNIEYWECSVCGACFTDVENGIWVEKEDTVLAALGHDFEGQEAHATPAPIAPTCTTDGFERKTCNRCGEDIDLVLVAPGHQFDFNAPPALSWDPTCDEWGAKIWACLTCGAHGHTEMVEPLGHSKPDTYNKATCTTDGSYDCTVCGKAVVEEKTGHHVVSKTVASNCVTVKYTFTYCDNANCPLELVSVVTVGNVAYDVTIPDPNSDDLADRIPVHLVGTLEIDTDGGVNADPDHIYDQEMAMLRYADCVNAGVEVYYCTYCREHAYKEIPALGHTMVDDTSKGVGGYVAPTCTDKGYIATVCVDCGLEGKRAEVPALGHVWDDGVVTKYPTCISTGILTMTCDRCGDTKTQDIPKHVPVIEYTVEEIAIYHPNATLASVKLQGSCNIKGLYFYDCPDCDESYLVVQPNTGAGHKTPDGYTVIVGDCTTDTVYPAYNCAICGELVAEVRITAKGHKADPAIVCPAATACGVCGELMVDDIDMAHKATDADYKLLYLEQVSAKDPTCTEDGYSMHFACKYCDYTFGKEVVPALNHKNLGVYASRDFTCTLFGYTHYMCPDCKGDANGDLVFGDAAVEYIIGYRKALGHNWILDEDASYAPTCETTGLNVYICENGARCKHEDGKVYGTYSDVIPATGHKNAAGEIFYNDCLDTTVDRVCVNENCDIAPNEEGKRVVPQDHHAEIVKKVEATCIQEAYELHLCTNCMEHWVVKGTYQPEIGKHIWERTGAPEHGYWEYEKDEKGNDILPTFTKPANMIRVCTDCGLKETKVVTKPGVEFSIEADNAVVSGAGYADSSLVAVKIVMNSADIAVWGVRLNLSYNPDVMKYVGYEIVSETFTVNQAAHDNGDYVTLVANTANTEDKKAQDLPIAGTADFAVVYFRIDNRTAVSADFGFVNDAANDKICEVIKANKTAVDTNVDVGDENAVTGMLDVVEKITIEKFLDVNADGDVSLEDALAFYNLAKADGYDVVADVDKDGQITLDDLTYLYEYLVGSKTYADMVAQGV